MKRSLMLGSAVAMLLMAVGNAHAQQARDTVQITIQGTLTSVYVDSALIRTVWHIGDTIQFQASAVDSAGDPVSATFQWSSSDTTKLRFLDPQSGIAVAVGKTMGSGGVYVYVLAQQVDTVVLGFFRPDQDPPGTIHYASITYQGSGQIVPIDSLIMAVGSKAQLCAYFMYGGDVVSMSQKPPGRQQCPIIGAPVPATALALAHWPRYYRTWVDYGDVRRMLRGL